MDSGFLRSLLEIRACHSLQREKNPNEKLSETPTWSNEVPLALHTWWRSPVVSTTTRLHLIPNYEGTDFVLLALLQPWNRFSKTQECEFLLGWLSCFHSRNRHGIMHSLPHEERVLHINLEKARSQIPHMGVFFSDTGITLMTSWQNFCNQSRPLKYCKTQNSVLLLTDLPGCWGPHHPSALQRVRWTVLSFNRELKGAYIFRAFLCLFVNWGEQQLHWTLS